ncbi:MAG: glycosyltransferase family 2 protein [Candidatus Omnitrophica bacterium]|nr:glycosyltransferase family 2 protein [Candidatus Omnitrophota bacterium]
MLVSVVIPTHKQERRAYLKEALGSVLSQTYSNFEIIIVDDGSGLPLFEEFKECYTNGKIRVIRHESSQGISIARNHAVEESRGELIAFLDDDDIWNPDNLERKVQIMRENPNIAMVGSNLMPVNEKVEPLLRGRRKGPAGLNTLQDIIFYGWTPPSGILVRKRCLEEIGGFDPSFKAGGEDEDLYLRLGQRFSCFFLNEDLGKYRVHTLNTSSNLRLNIEPAQAWVKLLDSTKHRSDIPIPFIKRKISRKYFKAARAFVWKGNFEKAFNCFLEAIRYVNFNLRAPNKTLSF